MSCSNCYKDYINCGVTEIVISTDVAAATEYNVIITAPSGAKYKRVVTSDVFGDITIPLNTFPTNLFNPYAGAFTIHIDIGCDDLLFCDYYKYFQFEVVNGDEGKNTLSCCEPSDNSTVMTCCTTTTIPFVNEAVTTVPYTGTRPSIEVAYLNPDNTYTLGGAGIFSQITFNATNFVIDHGGVSSGIVKLLK